MIGTVLGDALSCCSLLLQPQCCSRWLQQYCPGSCLTLGNLIATYINNAMRHVSINEPIIEQPATKAAACVVNVIYAS